jgi:hypothetical protein
LTLKRCARGQAGSIGVNWLAVRELVPASQMPNVIGSTSILVAVVGVLESSKK